MFHQFDRDITGVELPQKFTYPFNYTPHQLTVYAAEQVRRYLSANAQYSSEASEGKMFGVLVVKDNKNRVGFLAAFSGNLMGTSTLPYFVPPVFDFLAPDGYFKRKEGEISNINIAISAIIDTPEYQQSITTLEEVKSRAAKQIALAKQHYNQAKLARSVVRASADCDSNTLQQLNSESQFMKGEIKRLEARLKQEVEAATTTYNTLQTKVEQLKSTRKELSAELQGWLFDNFQLKNAQGNSCGLRTIFEPTPQKYPPAGAGECAAPKLLHYALTHRYTPLSIGEFWVGRSPRGEVRREGEFYGACRGKCAPILSFVLQGIEMEVGHVAPKRYEFDQLEILFEDQHLVAINKPSGLLSVEGRGDEESLERIVKSHYGESATMVHRLDQDTSGVILVAKSSAAYRHLQSQFVGREVKKRYLAIVEGQITDHSGVIELPISPNPLDRPRQVVDFESGKSAKTSYTLLGQTRDGWSRLALYPYSGRTHQLRLHCAHASGLDTPIVGDRLYGSGSDSGERLMLHAESITFVHPISGLSMVISCQSPF